MALIFVVGTGRCGTSTVARLCHNHGIACMGHHFEGGNVGNPRGYFEDKENQSLVASWMTGRYSAELFEAMLRDAHHHFGTIGFKHSILSGASKEQWEELEPRHIFWPDREPEQIIHSLQHYRDWRGVERTREDAEKIYYRKHRELSEALSHWIGTRVTKIDFSKLRTDGWVLGRIMAGLKGGSK